MTNNGSEPPQARRDIADLLTVLALILDDAGGQPGLGRIPCPICRTGVIGYSIAGTRAAAAKCTTPGCIAFMY